MKTRIYKLILDNYGQNRMRVRLLTNKKDLIDLMFQYEALINDQWIPIVRFDLAHGFFHKDTLYPNGDKVKQKIEITSLKTAAEDAKKDIANLPHYYVQTLGDLLPLLPSI
jgi:hypothetical protein